MQDVIRDDIDMPLTERRAIARARLSTRLEFLRRAIDRWNFSSLLTPCDVLYHMTAILNQIITSHNTYRTFRNSIHDSRHPKKYHN